MSTEASRHQHHRIEYIELTVSDLAAAKAFYTAAFGWNFTDYGPEYSGIQNVVEGDPEMGGLALGDTAPRGDQSGPLPGLPLIVLFSSDLDKTLAAVRDAGGAIVKEPFEFPGGRRFHFSDPAGNMLAVWTPA